MSQSSPVYPFVSNSPRKGPLTAGPTPGAKHQAAGAWVLRFKLEGRAAQASPPFEPDVIEITDAGGVRVVAVTKHGDIDQVRWRRILPDLPIDATEVDLFVEPTAGPLLAGVSYGVWESADVFVVSRFQPIAPDHLHARFSP
jgi:hypothetical protein